MKEHLDEIRNTLIELNSLQEDIKFITDRSSEYFSLVINQSAFFMTTYKRASKLLIIDLCKLLNPKEHYCYKELVEKIPYKKYDLTLEEIEGITNTLSYYELHYLDRLKILRDKFYVHNDKNKNDFTVLIKLAELWEILEELNKIFDLLDSKILNRQVIRPENPEVSHEVILIKRLILIENFIHEQLLMNPASIEYQNIKKILKQK